MFIEVFDCYHFLVIKGINFPLRINIDLELINFIFSGTDQDLFLVFLDNATKQKLSVEFWE